MTEEEEEKELKTITAFSQEDLEVLIKNLEGDENVTGYEVQIVERDWKFATISVYYK